MKTQLKDYKDKLEQAQGDLSAWKFTPDRLASLESTSQAINTLTSSTLYSPSVVCALYCQSCVFVCYIIHRSTNIMLVTATSKAVVLVTAGYFRLVFL